MFSSASASLCSAGLVKDISEASASSAHIPELWNFVLFQISRKPSQSPCMWRHAAGTHACGTKRESSAVGDQEGPAKKSANGDLRAEVPSKVSSPQPPVGTKLYWLQEMGEVPIAIERAMSGSCSQSTILDLPITVIAEVDTYDSWKNIEIGNEKAVQKPGELRKTKNGRVSVVGVVRSRHLVALKKRKDIVHKLRASQSLL